MKLKVIAKHKDGTPCEYLTLTKERRKVKYGDIFSIEDESRAKDILNTTFNDNPVVEVVFESKKLHSQKRCKNTPGVVKKV